MSKFRKRPVVVEAVQFIDSKEGRATIYRFCPGVRLRSPEPGTSSNALEIMTLEGPMEAIPGDWIIKGVKGEFYPCKPDIFKATYEWE